MDDLTQYLPHLLALAGGAMQWLRAQTKFPEYGYHLLAVAACLGSWFLVNDFPHDRVTVIKLLIWIPAGLSSVWGGTFIVSNAAKTASPAAAATNPLIPLTNSK